MDGPFQVPPLPAGVPVIHLAGAPASLQIRSEAPRPLMAEDADVGVGRVPPESLPDSAYDQVLPRHRLVTIGDSITAGFKSLAITDTALSWPALVAERLGFKGPGFTYPEYSGPSTCPGLPLNLEAVVRGLDTRAGGRPEWHPIRAALTVGSAVHAVKTYWEQGAGTQVPSAETFCDNLAVYGWDLRDALDKSRGVCEEIIHSTPFIKRHSPAIDNAAERSALRAFAGPSSADDPTMLSAAKALGDDGRIETLVVALGANNALDSVISLELAWSGPEYDQLGPRKDSYTVWDPDHFEAELLRVASQVGDITAVNVIWATVPHVTIVPLLRGVGVKPDKSRYFKYYTHAWINDEEFTPLSPHLTGDQARAIDSAIDQYNYAIKNMVWKARNEDPQRNWLVLDLCGLLDRLAYRRYINSPGSRPSWWDSEAYKLPPVLHDLPVRPDTRFFKSDVNGRSEGGLIALDGVHPTTVGYGLIADEVLRILALHTDVAVPPGPTPGINFAEMLKADTLLTAPPLSFDADIELAGVLNEVIDVVSVLLGRRAP